MLHDVTACVVRTLGRATGVRSASRLRQVMTFPTHSVTHAPLYLSAPSSATQKHTQRHGNTTPTQRGKNTGNCKKIARAKTSLENKPLLGNARCKNVTPLSDARVRSEKKWRCKKGHERRETLYGSCCASESTCVRLRWD